MKQITKKQLLSLQESNSLSSDSSIRRFISDASRNFKENKGDFEDIKSSTVVFEIFKFSGKELIKIPRQLYQSEHDKTILQEFTEKQIEKTLKKFSGNDTLDTSILFDLQKGTKDLGKATKLKQDFVCYAIHYYFKHPKAKAFDFINHLFFEKISLMSSNLDISSTWKDLKEFLYHENHSYLVDAIGTAYTIKKNRQKLKLKGSLTSYVIAEESSELGNIIKQTAYDNIKKNERNYYTAADKLTTADLFLYNRNNLPKDSSQRNFRTVYEIANDKNLSHDAYMKYINKSLISGYIIPISLKKLEYNDLAETNGNLETSKVKIINVATSSNISEDVVDPFLGKVIELFSIQNKPDFISEMEKVIDIRNETISLNMYGTRSTFNFDATFKVGKTETYDVFIQTNQIYIKPPGSSSNSGLGGISMEYIKKQILSNLPQQGSFIRNLKNLRQQAFEDSFNNEYDVLTQTVGSLNKSRNELLDIAKKYKIYQGKYKKEAVFRSAILDSISLANPKKTLERKQLVKKEIARKSFNDLVDYLADKKVNWSPEDIRNDILKSRVVSKYTRIPLLQTGKILSPSEYQTVFSKIKAEYRDDIVINYILSMQDGIENIVRKLNITIDKKFLDELFVKKGSPLSSSEKSDLIYNKLSTMEFLYFIGCDESVVQKWIKNALIMGIYGISSASGVIILNGKQFTKDSEGQFVLGKNRGKTAITRRNPMYVKIGM